MKITRKCNQIEEKNTKKTYFYKFLPIFFLKINKIILFFFFYFPARKSLPWTNYFLRVPGPDG